IAVLLPGVVLPALLLASPVLADGSLPTVRFPLGITGGMPLARDRRDRRGWGRLLTRFPRAFAGRHRRGEPAPGAGVVEIHLVGVLENQAGCGGEEGIATVQAGVDKLGVVGVEAAGDQAHAAGDASAVVRAR